MSFTVVIPARYDSTRLPGKILKDIHGKTMLHRVCDCVKKSSASTIIVATDDERIVAEAKNIGVDACMTSKSHTSGTQRISEVVELLSIAKDQIIVNVQGDEPFLPASCIEQAADLLSQDPSADMATLYAPLSKKEEIFDSNVVKLVANQNHEAMYFSRAPIPWFRDEYEKDICSAAAIHNTYRHIGIYAYRAGFIRTYVAYPPSLLEQAEKLEQLRALWYGHTIKVAKAIEIPGPGVDSESDLNNARNFVQQHGLS